MREHHPLIELTRARLLEVIREPGTVFWIFGFPVLMAIGLGIAFREQPPEPARVGIVADAPDVTRLRELLVDAPHIVLVEIPGDRVERALARTEIDLVVQMDEATAPPTLTYRFDPQRPEARLGRRLADDTLQRGLGRQPVATIEEQTDAPKGGRYIDFLLPGLLGLNIMGGSMWSLGYAMVQTRRRRLLRAFAVTPMRRTHFLMSWAISRLVFLVLEVGALLGFGWLFFDVAVSGSVLSLAVVALAGAIGFSGIALLTSSRTDSAEVVSGMMNLIMLPMWLLSGSFFNYERFPEVIHAPLRALPLTALNDALRIVISDGGGVAQVLPELGVLAAWGLLGFALAARLFRWQ